MISRLFRRIRAAYALDLHAQDIRDDERARCAGTLTLHALWLRLSCVGLMPSQRRENLYAAQQLDALARSFRGDP